MTEEVQVHLKACEFANKCRVETTENRKQQGLKPFTHDEQQAAWLNHYDGFVKGYIQRMMDTSELGKDKPQIVKCQNDNGEDVLKWVKPSKMENNQ